MTLTKTQGDLERQEERVQVALRDFSESYYAIGMELRLIRDKQLYRDAGFSSWSAYAASDRLPMSRTTARNTLAAATVLQDWGKKSGTRVPDLPLWVAVQISRLPTRGDRNRKLDAWAKRQTWPTKCEAKRLIDKAMGVEEKQKEKKREQLQGVPTAAEKLKDMIVDVQLWRKALGVVPNEFWSDAEADAPGVVEELAAELSALSSFLRDE